MPRSHKGTKMFEDRCLSESFQLEDHALREHRLQAKKLSVWHLQEIRLVGIAGDLNASLLKTIRCESPALRYKNRGLCLDKCFVEANGVSEIAAI